MVVPCPPSILAYPVPVAHKLILGARKAVHHVGRHVWHRVHHVVHSAVAHPQLLVSTACQRLPGALAAIALAVIPPVSQASPPGAIFSPIAQIGQMSPQGDSGGFGGAAFGGGGIGSGSGPAGSIGDTPAGTGQAITPANYGSDVITLPSTDVASAPAVVQSQAPYQGGPVFSLPTGASGPAMFQGSPIPEPSSLPVLFAALCATVLIRRRSVGRYDTSVLPV